jgi:predicted nucleic acid-binding protein
LKPVVIDASVAATWVIQEESTPATQALYGLVCEDSQTYHAPLLWHWETSNLLLSAARARRISDEEYELALQLFEACQLNFDVMLTMHRKQQVLRLAKTHQLTFYDATYLELVLRLNGQLASFDKQLINAARACGITCLDF